MSSTATASLTAPQLHSMVSAHNFYSMCCANPSASSLINNRLSSTKINAIRTQGVEAAARYCSDEDMQKLYRTVSREMEKRKRADAESRRNAETWSGAPPPPAHSSSYNEYAYSPADAAPTAAAAPPKLRHAYQYRSPRGQSPTATPTNRGRGSSTQRAKYVPPHIRRFQDHAR
jgi:hypothetical protein